VPLNLSIKKGERVVINGGVLSFSEPVKVSIHNKVAVMREGQLMHPEDANTPARRIYFAAQSAYIADRSERATYIKYLESYVSDFAEATTIPIVKDALSRLMRSAQENEFYAALKVARRLIEYEDTVLPPEMRGVAPTGSVNAGPASQVK
jgi:flagellar biosynthesis repressor protein FlbT